MRQSASHPDDGRYRLLIEAITDYAIYMLDPTGIITSWNPGAQRFKGYAAEEIIGQHFSRFYTEEDRSSGLPDRALETARLQGKFEHEGWRVRKDGTRFWAYVVIDPIRAPSGDIVGYAKITRDLTERRTAEEGLRKSQEQFRLLVQGVSDYAIYMVDKDGHVTNWNSGAERIKGYRPDEVIGKHFSRFYTEEDRAAGVPKLALETAEREGRWEKEGWRVRKDGSKFWAHVVLDAVRDDARELIGFATITRDITERREAQEKLEKTREALLQSQKMEAIGQLTGGIAHDFNNLLMAVLGSLELAKKRLPDDSRLRALIDNAVQGAQRGATLTKRMLAFAGRQELKQEPINIPDLVRGMTGLLQGSLGPSVHIDTHFPLGIRDALADPAQLEIAVLNLVLNARDAMPEGGRVLMSAREEMVGPGHTSGAVPGSYIVFEVTDGGIGMDEKTMRQAVQPFFTTKGPGKGTGLGLPMVHGVAEQSGGRLLLRSKQGEGTTAEIWLRMAEEGSKKQVRQQGKPEVQSDPLALVVLAVDDDPLVLTNTTAMLEDLGHIGIAACSGKEALDVLERDGSIDAVITDQAMPNMTGLQLAEIVRKRWPGLSLILASGYAEIAAGAGRTFPKLAKPYSENDLAAVLRTVRRKKRAGNGVTS